MKKFKKLTALLLTGALAFSMTACQGKSGGEGESSSGKTPLKISHHPYIHALPSVYAKKHGLYDKFNYTITQYSDGPVQNEAIASGAWEVGTTGIGGALLGAAGYDLKIIGVSAGDTNTTDLWVRPNSALAKAKIDANGIYGTAEEWKGLKILCQTGTSCHMVLIATLEHLGLTESDVEIIDTPVAQSYAAFKAGEADVVALWSPFCFQAEQNEKLVKVSSALACGIELPCLVVATEETVKNRPEVVSEWLKAYLAGVDGIRKDEEEEARLLFDFDEEEGISITEELAKEEVKYRPFPSLEENKQYFIEDDNGSARIQEILLRFADFMIDQGKLTKTDKQNMIDNCFIQGNFILEVDG